MSKWIWKFGDMELYHNMQIHGRRQNYGYIEPVIWKLYPPEPVVRFRKKLITDGGMIRITAQGDYTVVLTPENSANESEIKFWGASDILLPKGSWDLMIRISNYDTFPAVYVEGAIESDESWEADDTSENIGKVGTSPLFEDRDRMPAIFPFTYREIRPVRIEWEKEGILVDFGRESFAIVTLSGPGNEEVLVSFGESYEEALDTTMSVIHETRISDPKGKITFPACAFRYVYIVQKGCTKDSGMKFAIRAMQEMLDEIPRGTFTCNEEIINRVYNTAQYTFWLNCREFFLDGIKRDHWVWSADAYQSMFVNHYLFMDPELEKRTLTALGGGLPVVQYINTIMDYSYFWLISLWNYYVTYGDRKFIEQIYPQAKAHMEFCAERRSEDGLIRGRKGDWIFIDWADMDKEGALLGEQILLFAAMEDFGRLSEVVTGDAGNWQKEADHLREIIQELYYDTDRGVYIDTFESGRKQVTRQNNLLAYLYLHISREQKKSIYEKVILNEDVPAITTPYFKFYENCVICEEEDEGRLEESLRNYYGSMLEQGATTLYEQYDPMQVGVEHYAMYGRPYEKSLCHAWSCSPIYLLGAYRMGVKNTGIAYDTFEVAPKLGGLASFEGVVPLPKGEVHVVMNEKEVRVLATAPGGTLLVNHQRLPLTAGQECIWERWTGQVRS